IMPLIRVLTFMTGPLLASLNSSLLKAYSTISDAQFGQILSDAEQGKGGRWPPSTFVVRAEHERSASGAPDHGHCAAVLRPARDVVANRDRTLLAIGDGPDTAGRDATRDQEIACGCRTARAEREVVFASSPLVGMTFDGDRIGPVLLQPLGLTRKGRL